MRGDQEVVLMTASDEHGDGAKYRHIPGSVTGGYHTLCGFCDCQGVERDWISEAGPPDCPDCLRVVERALEYRKYASPKRKK